MKLRYIRIFLRTFAIGLAAVWIVSGLKIAWRDKSVDLPAASQDVLYTFPIEEEYIGDTGAGGGGAGGARFTFFGHGCGDGYIDGYDTDDGQRVDEGVAAGFTRKEARRRFLKLVGNADHVIEKVSKFRDHLGQIGDRVVIQNKPDDDGKESVSILFYDGGDSYRFIDAPTLNLALEFEQYLISNDFRSPF